MSNPDPPQHGQREDHLTDGGGGTFCNIHTAWRGHLLLWNIDSAMQAMNPALPVPMRAQCLVSSADDIF